MGEQACSETNGLPRPPNAERASPSLIAALSVLFRAAVLEDFIEDLPRPVRPAELARRLHLSQSLMDNHIATGALAAVLTESGWVVDTVAGHGWIDHFLLSVTHRLMAFPEVLRSAAQTRSLLAMVGLRAAVIEDFLDDLPILIGPAELALRLRLKRAVVYDHIARGELTATRSGGRLAIQVDSNRRWIADRIVFVSEPAATR